MLSRITCGVESEATQWCRCGVSLGGLGCAREYSLITRLGRFLQTLPSLGKSQEGEGGGTYLSNNGDLSTWPVRILLPSQFQHPCCKNNGENLDKVQKNKKNGPKCTDKEGTC